MRGRTYQLFMLGLIFALAAIIVPAASANTQLRHRGWATSYVFAGSNFNPREFASLSVSGLWQQSLGRGIVRVRAFARIQSVQAIYPPSQGWLSYPQTTEFRLTSPDSNAFGRMFINGFDPGDRTSGFTMPLIVYDLLDYAGVPNQTIQAYVNNFTTSSISTAGCCGSDVTRTYQGTTSNKMSLANDIPWNDSDKRVATITDGASAQSYFKYDSSTPYQLRTEVRVQYAVQKSGSFPAYFWSGWAGVTFNNNN